MRLFYSSHPIASMIAAILVSAAPVGAESNLFWGGLEPGPYKVGFKTVEKFDHSRTYRAKTDYYGQPLEGERSRPIQIFIWYPAPASQDGHYISYAEYTYSYPEDTCFIDILGAIQNRENLRAIALGGNRPGFINDLICAEVNAIRDAGIAPGDFPLILYFPRLESSSCENSVLCEFLASHGYIVATNHPLGPTSLTPALNQTDLETTIGDAQFIFGCLNDFAGWDRNRLGVLGCGSGEAAALLFQMRNGDVEAVAAIGGGLTQKEIIALVRANPFFNVEVMHFPLLSLGPGGDAAADWSLLENLPFASRQIFELPGADSLDFANTRALLSLLPDTLGQRHQSLMSRHETVCRIVRSFFDAGLKQSPEAAVQVADISSFGGSVRKVALNLQAAGEAGERPPTSDQLLYVLNNYGPVQALELYEKFSPRFPGRYRIPEAQVNVLGYQHLGAGRIEEAVAAFKLNADAHPTSANCWDSYADGCRAAGDTTMIIMCYRKVLETIPQDQNLDETTRAVIRNNAETFLNSLEKK